jgi:aspartate ammonia-lyase
MALGDWRTATKRIRHDVVETRGEVVELGVASLENRAHTCRAAMRRLESAITEVADAILEYEDAQAAFVVAVAAAGTGTACSPNTINVSAMTGLVQERLDELKKAKRQ